MTIMRHFVQQNSVVVRQVSSVYDEKFEDAIPKNVRISVGALSVKYISTEEASKLCGISSRALSRRANKGTIRGIKGLYKWLLCEEDILKLRPHETLDPVKTFSLPKVKHGMAGTKEHRAWLGMKHRCRGYTAHHRAHYKDKGITVCPEWEDDFLAFYKHIGPAPSPKHTVDRIRNDRGYKPGNVRWATHSEQMKNRAYPRRRK